MNGLQVAFEVGGPGEGTKAGMLQAKRSADLQTSRLELINMGLKAGQTACSTNGTHGTHGARECCVDYELSQQEGGFFRRAQLAVLRNPMARTTTYEAAFNKTDLLGSDPAHVRRWAEGLQFGFSFVINDGDDEAKQNGWAGYYPHAIVRGWNDGQKEPQKAGTVRLVSADAAPPRKKGGGAGSFFLGVFLTLLFLFLGRAFIVWREGGLSAVKRLVNPFADRARPSPTMGGPVLSSGMGGYSSYTPPA